MNPPIWNNPATGQSVVGLLASVVVALMSSPAGGQCQFARFTYDNPAGDDATGQYVAAHGDLALVTSWHTDDPNDGWGEVVMLRITPDGYEQVTTFRAGQPEEIFGWAAALDEDRLAISFFFSERKCWVYDRIGDEWVYSAELRPPGDPVHDLFGKPIVLADDTIAVTIMNYNGVYVYERDALGEWSEGTVLRPADMSTVLEFGSSLALSGDTLIVGAPADQVHGLASGSAFIFERTDPGVWEERQKLMPDDLVALDAFGDSVAIEGDVAFVGSPGWLPQYVYVYERGQDGVWRETQRFTSGSDTPESEGFGTSLDVWGDLLLVGDIGFGYQGPAAGAGWLFHRGSDNRWSKIARLVSPDVVPYGKMGRAVALTDSFAVLGAPKDTVEGVNDAGSAVFFTLGEAGPDHDGNGMPDVCECVGNVDGDRDVDGDDLHELLLSWGAYVYQAVDLDGDNDTDQSDLGILLTYYGQVCD
jgi:FG-GAP repeat